MILATLFSEPLLLLAWIVAMVIAITIHEFAHAWASYSLGDPTAKDAGRLTLNPLKHLDLWGTIMLLVAGFGWGKPVPYNPYNLKNQRWGPALISLAGPGSNLALVIIFGLLLRFLVGFEILPPENMLFSLLQMIVLLNVVLFTFNLIPIPPLDGSKLLFALLPDKYDNVKIFLATRGPFILLALIILDRLSGVSFLSFLFVAVLKLVAKIIGI